MAYLERATAATFVAKLSNPQMNVFEKRGPMHSTEGREDGSEITLAPYWMENCLLSGRQLESGDVQKVLSTTYMWLSDYWKVGALLRHIGNFKYIQLVQIDTYAFTERIALFKKHAQQVALVIKLDRGGSEVVQKAIQMICGMEFYSVQFICITESTVETLSSMLKGCRTKQVMIQILPTALASYDLFQDVLKDNLRVVRFDFHYEECSETDKFYAERNLSISRWIDRCELETVADLGNLITKSVTVCCEDIGVFLPSELAKLLCVFTYGVK